MEPFFIKLALFDAHKGVKISEDLHIDLNESNVRSLLPKRKKLVRVGLDYEEVDFDEDEDEDAGTMESLVNAVREVGLVMVGLYMSNSHPPCTHPPRAPPTLYKPLPLFICPCPSPSQGVFSVLFPNPEVFLVARIEKVLHGTIQSCAEPYHQKGGDSTKVGTSICVRPFPSLQLAWPYKIDIASQRLVHQSYFIHRVGSISTYTHFVHAVHGLLKRLYCKPPYPPATVCTCATV